MTDERRTYTSEKSKYDLNPAKVFEVVADLDRYMSLATAEALRDNPEVLKPATGFRAKGRKMVVSTEVVNCPGVLTSFDLAELVLSAEKDKLTLRIHAHPKVTIPSKNLHYIGREYQR